MVVQIVLNHICENEIIMTIMGIMTSRSNCISGCRNKSRFAC